MSKKPCTHCGEEKDTRGLVSHEKACVLTHGADSNGNSDQASDYQEGEEMADCANCAVKDLEIRTGNEKAEQLTKSIEGLTEQNKALSHYPSVQEFVSHCEGGSCSMHANELEAFQKAEALKALSNLSKDFIATKAQEMGIFPKTIEVAVS